jgi:hypothetical protein
VPSPALILEGAKSARKPLHIVATDSLEGNEVLVRFSDGSAAIYEAEELEKLRPTPKQLLPDARGMDERTATPIAS